MFLYMIKSNCKKIIAHEDNAINSYKLNIENYK